MPIQPLSANAASDLSSNLLKLRVSGEHYKGEPKFKVHINGEQLGDTYTVSADHRQGEFEEFEIDTGLNDLRPDQVEVEFLNDLWEGSREHDRNLVVDQIEIGGLVYDPQDARYARAYGMSEIEGRETMYWSGRLIFDTAKNGQTAAVIMDEDTEINLALDAMLQALNLSPDTVTIDGLPQGAELSSGSQNDDGSWTLSSEQLSELSVFPPTDSDENFAITVKAGNDNAFTIPIQVNAVVDSVDVNASTVRALEDQATALALEINLNDNDGSEQITKITISNVPEGRQLSAGRDQGEGVWELTQEEINGLTITPPANSDTDFNLNIAVTNMEISSGESVTTTIDVPVTVEAVADAVIIDAGDTVYSTIKVQVSGDHYEGEPKFQFAIDGELQGDIYSVSAEHKNNEWQEFTFRGDFGEAGPENVQVIFLNDRWGGSLGQDRNLIVDYLEVNGGRYEPQDASYTRAYDQAQLSGREKMSWGGALDFSTQDNGGPAAFGREDRAIELDIDVRLADSDGSEAITKIQIAGVPDGAVLSAGQMDEQGNWTLTREELTGLSLTPAVDSNQDFQLTVNVTTTEQSNQDQALSTLTIPVKIKGIADMPVVTVKTAQGEEDHQGVAMMEAHEVNMEVTGVDAGGATYVDSNLEGFDSGNVFAGEIKITIDGEMHTAFCTEINEHIGFGSYNHNVASLRSLPDSDGGMSPQQADLMQQLFEQIAPGTELKALTLPDTQDLLAVSGDIVLSPAEAMAAQILIWEIAHDYSSDATSIDLERGQLSFTSLSESVRAAYDGLESQLDFSGSGIDQGIPLSIDVGLSDKDGSESLSIEISGLPDGASLSAGNADEQGSWALTANQLNDLRVIPAEHSDANFTLAVAVTAHENDSDSIATSISSLVVTVDAAADAPSILSPDDLSTVTIRVSGSNIGNGFPEMAGPPAFRVYIDGEQVGGVFHASADFAQGEWQEFTLTGGWGDLGPQTVEIEFTDDLWCAPFCADKDLLVDYIRVNETPYEPEDAMYLRYAIAADHPGADCDPELIAANIAQGLYEAGTGAVGESILEGQERMAWNGRLIFDTRNNGGPQGIVGNEDTDIPLYFDVSLIDQDGSETLSHITISDLPTGVVLSAGQDNGDGTWTLQVNQLQGLTLRPPQDSDVDFDITITATTVEAANGDSASTSIVVPVVVNAVADQPGISASAAAGQEDTAIALDIAGNLSDLDGSESLSYVISQVPQGAELSVGIDNGDGSWTLTPVELQGLTITPPPGSDADFILTATVYSTEEENNDQAINSIDIPISVSAVVDAPVIDMQAARGNEDTQINLDFSAISSDLDGSEQLSITISQLPEGAVLSSGVDNGDGSWTLTPAQLPGLMLTPPADSDVDFQLNVAVTATETSTGETLTNAVSVPVTVDAVADAPSLKIPGMDGDSEIALRISGHHYNGAPKFKVYIDGEQIGETYVVEADQRQGQWETINIKGDFGSDGPGNIEVAFLNDAWGGSRELDRNLVIDKIEVNGKEYQAEEALYHPPTWASTSPLTGREVMAWTGRMAFNTEDSGGPGVHGDEDSPIPINLNAALADIDGSENFTEIIISDLPQGAELSTGAINEDGSWRLTTEQLNGLQIFALPDSNVDFEIQITAISTETENGSQAATTLMVPVAVSGVADQPDVVASDVSGNEDSFIALEVGGALNDIDGSESLLFVISQIPTGATLNIGTDMGDGSWQLSTAELQQVAVQAPEHFSGTFSMTVTAVATEDDGDVASNQQDFTVTVDAVADSLNISRRTARGDEDSPIDLQIGVSLKDDDGSEQVNHIIISDVPDGAILSAGIDNGDGSWTLNQAQLEDLQITPPADSNDDFKLKITTQSIDDNGDTKDTTKSVWVRPNGVADAPEVIVNGVQGVEDQGVALDLQASLSDVDGSETLSISIVGVPYGGNLSHGTNLGNGVWSVDPADLGELVFQAPLNLSGRVDMEFIATATENDGHSSISAVPFSVQLTGVSDMPYMEVRPARGYEDHAIALDIRPGLTDTDGSETLTLHINDVPEGAVLSAGEQQNDGSWIVQAADISALSITPPLHSNQDFTLSITAIASEQDGDQLSTTLNLPVSVKGIADAPAVIANDVTGNEDSPIQLDLQSSLVDNDSSEVLSVVLGGLPPGARLSNGLFNGNGTWSLDPSELDQITITPPQDFSGQIPMTLKVITTENDGDSTNVVVPFNVNVVGVVDESSGFSKASGREDHAIELNLNPGLNDIDGSEQLFAATISNLPESAVLSAGTETSPGVYSLMGSELTGLTVIPAHNSNENFTLDVTVTIVEADGAQQDFSGPLNVTVKGIADLPTIEANDINGEQGSSIALDFQGQLADVDGSESLYYILEDVPQNTYISAGYNNGDGSWTILPQHMQELSITPPEQFTGEIPLLVRAVARENDGDITDNTAPFTVVVSDPDAGNGNGNGNGQANGGQQGIIHFDDVRGNEDVAISLGLTDAINASTININGLPVGAVLSAGEQNEDASWTVVREDLNDLSVIPAEHSDADFSLQLSWQGQNGESYSGDIGVKVDPLADVPEVILNPMSGMEDQAVQINAVAQLVDQDGSEQLSYVIKDLPEGADVNRGFYNPFTQTWTIEASDLSDLQVTPPKDFSGDFSFSFGAVATESNGNYAVNLQAVNIPIEAVIDGPVIKASPETVVEDQDLALNLSISTADTDGSETVTQIVVSDLPDGAVLHGAENNGDGSYAVSTEQLDNLSITPPAHAHGSFDFTVTATAAEPNGDQITSQQVISFQVLSEPDAPVLSVNNASGFEDTPINLELAADFVDSDGSEVMSVIIAGIPDGAVLSQGMNNGDGSWTLTPGQLSGLSLTAPEDFSGYLNLTMSGITLEMDTFATASSERSFTVEVLGVADLPSLDIVNTSGLEDNAIPIVLNAQLSDTDGSENLSAVFANVPDGALLSAGEKNADGTWTVAGIDLEGLHITPTMNSDHDFQLTVTLASTDSGGVKASISDTIDIEVNAVVDDVISSVTNVSGVEDNSIVLDLSAGLSDIDGSEMLAVMLTGIPDGASLSQGNDNGDGSWSVTPAQLEQLSFTPPTNFSGSINLTMLTTVTEIANNNTQTTTTPFTIVVNALADTPTLTTNDGSGIEDQAVPLDISAGLSDVDGSESLAIVISGVPEGASLSAGAQNEDGSWHLVSEQLNGLSLLPASNYSGELTLNIAAIATDTDGSMAVNSSTMNLTVAAVSDAHTVIANNASGQEDNAIALDLQVLLEDRDGSESATVLIGGIPEGAALSAGEPSDDGNWQLSLQDLSGLSLTPPAHFSGVLNLGMVVSSGEQGNGAAVVTTTDFQISVAGQADEPELALNNSAGMAGSVIPLNIITALVDQDGSENLSLTLSGLPDGVSLNAGSINDEGNWIVSDIDFSQLAVQVPSDFSGDINLIVDANATEANGSTTTNSSTLQISVAPAVVSPEQTQEVEPILLHIETLLQGFDGSESIVVTVAGMPEGASLSEGEDNGDGSWTLDNDNLSGITVTPPQDFNGSFPLTLSAVATEADGDTAAASMTVDINVGLVDSGLSEETYSFGLGYGQSTFVGSEGQEVVYLLGLDHGPSDQIQNNDDWVLLLEEDVNMTETDAALVFENDASGTIVLSDGSELAFQDIVRVEW